MKSLVLPLLALVCASQARGQFLPGVDPRLPEAKPVESLPPLKREVRESDSGTVLSKKLTGVELSGGGIPVAVAPRLKADPELILPSPHTLAAKLSRFLGKPLREGDLVAIADTILLHYDVEGYPVVNVDAPEQDLAGGMLRLTLGVGRIGKVGVSAPKYGNPASIRRGLVLRRGEFLRRSGLDEQLAWYGRTIFRRPQLFVSPGEEPATADLLIAIAETKPWRATLGYENSGPKLLGRDRLSAGIAGMLPNEQVLAWQSLIGLPASSLHAHALSWEIPFQRLHQTLQLDASYAKVVTTSDAGGLPVENRGTSWTFSAMEKMTLPALGKWNQRLSAGFEVKGSDQFVLFGGSGFSPGEVRLVNGKISYALSRDAANWGVSAGASVLGSPGGLISGNHDEDFRAYDPSADATYHIARLNAQAWWESAADWRISLRAAAQAADSRLLPAEQFSAGGYQSVRGVPEREYYADGGCQSSLEIYGPGVTLRGVYQLRPLAFYDQAWLRNRGENSEFVAGAGVGLRLRLTSRCDLRIDQGWRLDEHGSETSVGVILTF